MQLLLQNDQCALAAPPGNDQAFLFLCVCCSKRSGLLRMKENNEGMAALLRVEGRLSTEGRQLMLFFIAWIRGSHYKVLVADASSAPVGSSATIRTVSADETDVVVVLSVSGETRALVLFCKALGVKLWPSPWPFVTKDFVGKASVTTASTTVARWLPSAVNNQKSVTSSLHLPSRHRQQSMLGQQQPNKQYDFADVGDGHKARLLLRWTTIGAQSVVKMMDMLVGNLTAAVVMLGNHLQTAIQRLHNSNSKIRSRCVGKD